MNASRAFLLQLAATLYVASVSLGLSVVLAVLLGPASFGAYAGIVTVASFLALLQDAGLRTLVAREHTAPTAGARFSPKVLVSLASGHVLLLTGAILAFVLLLPVRAERAALFWAVITFGAITLLQLGTVVLRAQGSFGRDAGWQIAARTVSALAVLVGIWLFGAEPAVVFAAWAAALLPLVLLHPAFRGLRPSFTLAPAHYRAAAGFLVIDLATFIYNRADILLLSLLSQNQADVGLYAAGYRLFDGAHLLAAPAATVLFRKLRLVHAEPTQFETLLGRSLASAAAIGIAMAVGGWLVGPILARSLFGEAYAAATGSVMQWLAVALVFALPNAVLTQAAIAGGAQRLYAGAAAVAACVNVGANLATIPVFGILGAAWTTIATEAALGLVLWLGLRRGGGRGAPERSNP
jgi:O-antigen/teichoic acid export membrane protein